MPIQFFEPHPSLPSSKSTSKARIGSGRGGAGNYTSYSKASLTAGPTASGPPARAPELLRRQSNQPTSTAQSAQQHSFRQQQASAQYCFSGIGGAGNARPAEERRIFSFDEELERDKKLMDSAALCRPVYHIGRGGSGNAVSSRNADRSDCAASVSSSESEGRGIAIRKSLDGVRGKLARALSRE